MAEENFSYSKLSTYKDCPFRFYLNYVLKNFAYSASIATEFGSAIHKCEEDIAHYIQDKKEIDYVIEHMPAIMDKLTSISPFQDEIEAIRRRKGF